MLDQRFAVSRRGFPHRIWLDECHLFLRDEQLLGDELDSYTLVTYRPSLRSRQVIDAVGVVASTRLSEQAEVDSLRRLAQTETVRTEWYELLGDLSNREAVLLPPTEEAEGRPRKFCVIPRLTHHVRHQSKYLDIPVSADRAFVFTKRGTPTGETSATLRELTNAIDRVPSSVLTGHAQGHDFSRWIDHLFADRTLANAVCQLESQHKANSDADTFRNEFVAPIERRYESDRSSPV